MGYILLIEDEAPLGRTYSRVLRGSRLVWTQRAEDAIDALEADDDVAVVLCDLTLKQSPMQGSDVLDIVKERWPQLLSRTFLMSGHEESDVGHLLQAPVRYLKKPVSIQVLREAVRPFEPDPA